MRLFELAGADTDLRFSPYVWRTRLALAHKGIEAERVPTRFLEKEKYAPSGSKTVPVIEDDGTWVADSWAIACYLEERHPDRPPLFGGAIGRGEARFINSWVDRTIGLGLFPMLAADIHGCLAESDKPYFRETREARLGMPLEEARELSRGQVDSFRASLAPLRATLKEQDYVCGRDPAYADYCAFAPFIWARCCSPFAVLADDDPIRAWIGRMDALFDGLAGKAKCAA